MFPEEHFTRVSTNCFGISMPGTLKSRLQARNIPLADKAREGASLLSSRTGVGRTVVLAGPSAATVVSPHTISPSDRGRDRVCVQCVT